MGGTTCEAADCARPSYARGYCERHYRQQLRHGAVRSDSAPTDCAVPGCGRKAVTRGWCHGHYLRWSRTGDVRADVPLARPQRDTCSVPDAGAERTRPGTAAATPGGCGSTETRTAVGRCASFRREEGR